MQWYQLKKLSSDHSGRIRPFVLAIVLVLSGVFLKQTWWQIGVVILIAMFVGAYYRYTTPH